MNNITKSNWDLPDTQPDIRTEEVHRWRAAVDAIRQLALANNWSKKQVADQADISTGVFSDWYSGKYGPTTHKFTERVELFLKNHEENLKFPEIMTGPDYIETPTSKQVMNALRFAHRASEFSVITLAAGMGKTVTCREYQRRIQHVYRATMRPQTATLHSMMVELCRVLDVAQNNPAKLDTAIGEKLKQKQANVLLIVDEAQNLHDRAVDQLRYFLDEYQCGIALLGNEEVYSRFAGRTDGPSFGQINRRVGFRIKKLRPERGDITAILDGWKIKDPDCRKILAAIGEKSGALGQITKTIQLASMSAFGEGIPMNVSHIEEAWQIRSVEGA